MKALSIRQPWAWLIANGYKDIENRNWPTGYRGPFLIHAAKGMTKNEVAECADFIRQRVPNLIRVFFANLNILKRGGVIGIATLHNCMIKHPSPWFVGFYGFVIKDARALPFFPCKGSLGFFNIDLPEDYKITNKL